MLSAFFCEPDARYGTAAIGIEPVRTSSIVEFLKKKMGGPDFCPGAKP